jgi:hypothetical protein
MVVAWRQGETTGLADLNFFCKYQIGSRVCEMRQRWCTIFAEAAQAELK